MSKDLVKISKTTLVNSSGELVVNGGKFARGAVLMAYEMMGGIDAFVEWAEENKGDFYTKMFGKVIGREVEHTVSDSVEALLDKLDAGVLENAVIDVTPEEIEEVEYVDVEPEKPRAINLRKYAQRYASGEPYDEEHEDY